MMQLSAVWFYQKHILSIMKVSASLGLTKTPWWHGMQPGKGIRPCFQPVIPDLQLLFLHCCPFLLAISTSLLERNWWGQDKSMPVKPVSSSRAQKQVHFTNLRLVFIPLWEMDCFPTTVITFKDDRQTVVLLRDSLTEKNTPWPSWVGQQKSKVAPYKILLLCPWSSETAVKY